MAKDLITEKEVEEQRGGTLRTWFEKPELVSDLAACVEGWVSVEEFKAQILLDMQDDKIVHCSPKSKFKAVLQCATLQLYPHLGEVALIPRAVKDGNGQIIRYDVSVMVQWQGYQSLFLRVPVIASIKAAVVHVTDHYVYDPPTESLVAHDFDPFDSQRIFRSLEDIRGGYLVFKFTDGRPDYWHFVHQDTIKSARNCAETLKVWDKWPQEMALKTLFRNCFNRRVIPTDDKLYKRLEALSQYDDKYLGNNPMREAAEVDSSRVIEYTPDPPKSRAEQMANKYTGSSSAEESPLEMEDTDEYVAPVEEPEVIAPADETVPPKSETKPKSSNKKQSGKKGQQSLLDEDDRTISKRLLDRVKEATSDNDLMVITDEASEWQSQGKITEEETQRIFEAVNQRQSEI